MNSNFHPVKVIDIEVSKAVRTLNGLAGYTAIKGLVRFYDTPLGYIHLPVINNKCEADLIIDIITKKFSRMIIRKCLNNWLLMKNRTEIASIDDLLKTPEYKNPKKQLPLITVAVCTRNRAYHLSDCLKALSQLDYPNLEIVVIDNASTSDETKRLVSRYPAMCYIHEPSPGLNIARNRAIFESNGEIIAFTDDDAIVAPGWLDSLINIYLESPNVMGVSGLVVPYELETKSQLLFENYNGFGRGFRQRWCHIPNRNNNNVAIFHGGTGKFGCGANMSFRRKVFAEIGYFDPALDMGTPTNGGGDLEMFFRVLKEGYAMVYEPGAVVYHKHRKKYSELKSQIRNWGIASTSYLVRSAAVYHDERPALLVQWFGRLLCRNIPRLFVSLIAPDLLTKDLIIAEITGSFEGLNRYQRSCAIVGKVVPNISTTTKNSSAVTSKNGKKAPTRHVVNIDLNQPLRELNGVNNYAVSEINIKFNNRSVGKVVIHNHYESIGIIRLSRAITEKLDIKLLKIIFNKNYPLKKNIQNDLLKYFAI